MGCLKLIYDEEPSPLKVVQGDLFAEKGQEKKDRHHFLYVDWNHLGNVRVVINGTKTSTGQADVVTYSDYYPYGSPMTLASNDYRYGYQGQFAEVDKETGWNNFQLRMYDPVIGRWLSTDPQGQFASPYLALGNNPIMVVDADGAWGHIVAGFVIGAGYSAWQLANEGKLNLSYQSLGKIALGGVSGAVTAAMPATFLGGIGAFSVATSSSIIDQSIDIHYSNKTGKDRPKLNYFKAGMDGVIGAASLGLGSTIAKGWRAAAIRNNWTGPLNRSFMTEMFYKNPGLTGLLAGNMLDFFTNTSKIYGPNMLKSIDRTLRITLPELVIKTGNEIHEAVEKYRPK